MEEQLTATYGDLRETLVHFAGLYGVYTHGRPKVVAEHVKTFQLHALAQDFLQVLEAFRLLACLALCPQACAEQANLAETFERVRLVEALDNLKLDLELVGDDPNFGFTAGSQQFLREAKQYAVTLVATAPHNNGADVDWGEALTACVAKVVSRIMFPLMKVVSLTAKQNESHTLLHAVTLDRESPASTSASYISPPPPTLGSGFHDELAGKDGEVAFGMLSSLATGARGLHLSLAPKNAFPDLCVPSLSPHLYSGSPIEWPRRWRLETADAEPVPRLVQMLEHVESSTLELSHSYLVLRPLGWTMNLSCSGAELDYDPTLCLQARGWGGQVFSVNVHPPFQAELRTVGRGLGDSAQAGESSFMDVLHPYPHQEEIETLSLDHLFYRIDFLWRQGDQPSPDAFFLHPAVHNCHAVEYLFTGAPIKPKLLVIPINPLIPPPFEVMPRFEAWWHLTRPSLAASSLAPWAGHEEPGTADESASIWLGQCSLSAVDAVLKRLAAKKFKYTLHHVDHAFAVYTREDIHSKLGGSKAPELMRHWLEGWFCDPGSRYFGGMELLAGPGGMRLASPLVPEGEKEAILCRLLEEHRVPVQRRSFDCQKHLRAGQVPAAAAITGAGRHSCIRPDLRGWGNEAVVHDSVQNSAFACEAQCARSNCSYWTFDPTSLYGQPLCWVWAGGRPAEIKDERGWISGDADCHRAQAESGHEPEPGAAAPKTAADAEPETSEPEAERTTRELFKQWSVQQPLEMPGMRFFLESGKRGRCVRGFCECFPPYRGPLCRQLDPGSLDTTRNFTAALHYLTSDDPVDIADIQQSLPRLWQRFNSRFDYPVVIFNDGLSERHREQIVRASENRIWFAYVDDYLDIPLMITQDPTRRASLDEVKWSLGYRGMCRFRSGTIFLQPVLRNFDYAMTLDTDGYFPADVASDPITAMHQGGYVYTFSHLLPDLPGAVKHFWEYSLMYMRMKDIHPRGTDILRQFVREEDVQWNYQLYMNDIEIVQLDWFRSEPYQDYFRFLDSVGGFWLHRWGDHAVRTIAVAMWLPREKVYEMDVPYGHQNYCRCSAAHPKLTCVREGDKGGRPPNWWVCAEVER